MGALFRFALLLACIVTGDRSALSEQVPVRYIEGLVHGFLALRTLDGNLLASGDLIQVARHGRVTNHLIFWFKDGSVHEETAVYSQRGNFRLLSNHLVQKGPTFPHSKDVSIDCLTGQITVRYADDDGKEKIDNERLELPPDLANGMIFTLLKNLRPEELPTKVTLMASTPKPRLVKLRITAEGSEPFFAADHKRRAEHYIVKVEIGGVAGAIAPIVGKQPADIHVWILSGVAPAFVKSEGQLYPGGPVWRIELASPVWSQPAGDSRSKSDKQEKH